MAPAVVDIDIHADPFAARQGFEAAADCVTSATYVPDLVCITLDLIIENETGLWHLVKDGETS